MLKVAFDVDGTLIKIDGVSVDGKSIIRIGDKNDTPRYDVIELYHLFEKFGNDMYIWSLSGIDYAKKWKRILGLNGKVVEKGSFKPDIAVDDGDIKFGIINLKV